MDQILDPRSLRRAAPFLALAVGAIVALLIAVLPQWRLEAIVAATGLADLFTAARPPLGATARSALALVAGGTVAAATYALSVVAVRWLPDAAEADPDAPVLRRADAHPDAPARRPLRASEELGQPLPIGRVAPAVARQPVTPRALPADLDTPLAAVDPAAIPDVPRAPVRPVAPLARPALVDEGDRVETFALTPIRRAPAAPLAESVRLAPESVPPPRPQPVPIIAPAQPGSLSALLDRLERGAARRGTRPAPSIEDTLGMLRGLATR